MVNISFWRPTDLRSIGDCISIAYINFKRFPLMGRGSAGKVSTTKKIPLRNLSLPPLRSTKHVQANSAAPTSLPDSLRVSLAHFPLPFQISTPPERKRTNNLDRRDCWHPFATVTLYPLAPPPPFPRVGDPTEKQRKSLLQVSWRASGKDWDSC